MKKNVKGVIAGVAVLAVLGGAYAAITLMDKDSGSEKSSSSASVSSEAEKETKELYSHDQADVASIDISNSGGSFKVVRSSKNKEDNSAQFTIEGYEDLDLNTTLVSSLASNASSMKVSVIEENAADLSKYGLKEPAAEVAVKFDGDEQHFYVGDTSPVSENTYFMVEGDSTVYTAPTSSVSIFTSESTYFINKTMVEASSDSSEQSENPIVKEMTIKQSGLDYDIVLKYDENTDDEEENTNTSGTLASQYMESPIFAYLDVEKVNDTVNSMFGLTADTVMTAHPNDAELAAAGLDKPSCTVEMKTDDGKTTVLSVGKSYSADDTEYAMCMVKGKDVIYAVKKETLKCWTDVKPEDIMSRMVFGTYVWDIGELSIAYGDTEVKFEGKGSSDEDYTVTKNGKECDTERFRSFYTYILKTAAEDLAIDESFEGKPECKIHLRSQNGKTDQIVEFYSQGKKSLIVVDGQARFKCRTAYVDLLIKNLEKFDGSEDFVMNW